MADITITIDTDGAAFEDDPFELTNLIRTVADRMDQIDLMNYDTEKPIVDTNGNTVGKLTVTQSEESG